MIEDIKKELEEALSTLQKVLSDEVLLNKIADASELMSKCLKNGGKIISCGNGGSHCDAMHFAEELSGRYRDNRPAMAAIAISDPSHISCVGNDYGFEFIFSRFVEGLGRQNDVLLGISTSGNSKNVIEAAKAAKAKGMKVIILSGNTGGKLAEEADIEIRVPHQGYADRIQEIHIKIIHILIQKIEKSMTEG